MLLRALCSKIYNGLVAKRPKGKRTKIKEAEPGGKKWHSDLKPETKKSVWAVFSFLLTVIFFLAWLGKAGLAGSGIYVALNALFGKAFLLIPVAFLLTGISFFYNMRERILSGTFMGGILFLTSTLALSDIIIGSKTAGLVGFALAYIPLTFLDRIASGVIFGALMMVSLLLIMNIPLKLPPFFLKKEENVNLSPDLGDVQLTLPPDEQKGTAVLTGVKSVVTGLKNALEKERDSSEVDHALDTFTNDKDDNDFVCGYCGESLVEIDSTNYGWWLDIRAALRCSVCCTFHTKEEILLPNGVGVFVQPIF